MYRFIGEQPAYDLFNYIAFVVTMISSLFYYKAKCNVMGAFSKNIVTLTSRANVFFGKVSKFVLVSIESLLMALLVDISGSNNKPFGNLVGTGANYFGLLFLVPITWFLLSSFFIVNPLKNIDIATLYLPVNLFFAKIACFCNGCCWGVDWEYGLYNHHYDHPGKQVPVQALEAFCALAIFVFLLIYRKKAKPGRLFPIYMIIYSATRFPIEFFSAAHEPVIGPFNTYHILCIIGIVLGILMLLFVRHFGEKISELFEKAQGIIDSKFAALKEKNDQKLAEKEARVQAEKQERREKAKRAREKASVKYKK